MRANSVLCLLGLVLSATAQRFVRFISTDGNTYAGDAILLPNDTDAAHSKQAKVITGDILGDFTITHEVKDIKTLLAPLDPERTRTVRAIGYNYISHNEGTKLIFLRISLKKGATTGAAKQNQMHANRTIPEWPILFYKPWTSLSTPSAPIPVTAGYQNQTNFTSEMDYETELVVVLKKKAFNITQDVALDYVLGYAAGHDVSHRGWQIDRGGEPQPQYSMGKGADGWAPWGPAIVSTSIIKDPQNLNLWTKVNGVLMQNDTTANMIFGVANLVSFLSMGITLLPGDIIFTGTPSGVQLGKANPHWLQNGDVVEVGTENIGTCTNTITYV